MELSRFWNGALAKEPLNWGVIFVLATFWLLAFHVIMQGFSAMQDNGGKAQGTFAPGLVGSQGANVGVFETSGSMLIGAGDPGGALSAWGPQGGGFWTDDAESRFAEDGIMNSRY
jgi:hypothetical protein